MSARESEQELSFEIYPRRDITIVRGEGATLWDHRGRAYIDCTAGVGVANVGHANPKVAAAVAHQAKTLVTCPGTFYNDVRAQLLAQLSRIAPGDAKRAFLCNSGTEATEAAIKFARHSTGKSHFVCAMRGFHGRTMGALSATFKYRDQFEPLLPGFSFVPFNNLEKLRGAVTDDTAAIMLEPVQGEGGVRVGDPAYFEAVQTLCRETGVLLIVDEIQTGFCRTGAMFASSHFGLSPDLLCLAKAIAGGIPMGAVLASPRVQATVGMHGTTFGGNPLASAAAVAAIQYMEEHDLAGAAKAQGDYFVVRFRDQMPPAAQRKVRELRQLGLMIGIELKEKATPYLQALMTKGVLALPAGPTVIRLLPPLVISRAEMDEVVNALAEVLDR